MIDYHAFHQIHKLRDQDRLSITQIAAKMGLARSTVAHWLAQKRYTARKPTPRKSKLDPFKPTLKRLLERHAYSGTQLLRILREHGFTGGKSILMDYLQIIRPPRIRAFLTLKFQPGECAQVDWGEYGSVNVGHTRRRLSFFVMVLCYSRMLYVEFTLGQAMEHFLGCHQHAFEFFGGVPGRIMVDNLKCAVLKRLVGGAPEFNPRYLAFARDYGFTISPCNVGKGNEKGRVENAVGYIKKNLLNGLQISDFSALLPHSTQWMHRIANVRIHGTTKKKPVELFEEEKKTLQTLPLITPETSVLHQIRADRCFRVTLDTNRYSVPWRLANKRLQMHAHADELEFYYEGRLVARHTRSYDRQQDFEDHDHVHELVQQRGRAKYQKLLARFLDLGQTAVTFHKGLQQRQLNAAHHVRRIMALGERYGQQRMMRSLTDCLEFGALSASYVENLLLQRMRLNSPPSAMHLTRKEDALDLELPKPDLDPYHSPQLEEWIEPPSQKEETDEQENNDPKTGS